jgi:hypothetical protein
MATNYGAQPPHPILKFWNAFNLITDAPWYVPNDIIRRDLQGASIKEEICCLSVQYYYYYYYHHHPFQPPSNSTLKAICFQKTEETPAIRSTPQIHCINM